MQCIGRREKNFSVSYALQKKRESERMETPRTYRGYNSDGKCVAKTTAQDANKWINPAEVKKAIEKVESVFTEQMNGVGNSLQNIVDDAEEAVIVQGTDMGKTIEETAKAIKALPKQAMEGIKTLYEYSIQAHDNLQKQANNYAYNQVAGTSGVVRIS